MSTAETLQVLARERAANHIDQAELWRAYRAAMPGAVALSLGPYSRCFMRTVRGSSGMRGFAPHQPVRRRISPARRSASSRWPATLGCQSHPISSCRNCRNESETTRPSPVAFRAATARST